ncbi:MAG: cell division protein FtsW [Chloroflexi bacterium]|nr:cell division protein FtsW [Chloroflexota bacterium]
MSGQQNIRQRPGRGWVGFDATLFVVIIALLVVGLLSVYSATVHMSLASGNPAAWFRRQLTWALLGLIAMFVTSNIPYHLWRRVDKYLLGGTLLLLLIVLFRPARFGSTRFLAGQSIQPSEVAKFALVVYAASWLSSPMHYYSLHNLKDGLLPYGIIVGLVAGLVAMQPDIGTAMLLGTVGLIMFFIAGADIKQFLLAVIVGGATSALLIAFSNHARQRIHELMAIWQNPDSERWSQLTQALRVMRSGGIFGQGPGRLDTPVPAIHHDFILAAVGHAFGLVGVSVVLLLFGLLAYRGYTIAARAPDPFGSFLAAGITTWLVLQALINMGVAVALVPPTGIPLPLVSYGGSAMLTTMAALGVLLNISQYTTVRTRHERHSIRGRDRGARVPRAERV